MSAEPNVEAPGQVDPALPPSGTTNSEASTHLPVPPEMPGAEGKSISIPNAIQKEVSYLTNNADEILTRLNKLLTIPGGVSSLLSTANYTLYLLAYLHSVAPTRAKIIATLSRYLGRAAPKTPAGALSPAAPQSPLLTLALVLGETRTTLRLLGLFPMYVWLTTLIRTRKNPSDRITHTISLVQCTSYMTFQLLENTLHLTNKGVLSPTNAIHSRLNKPPGKLMTYACRAWLSGISCDFLRLIREAQLNSQKRSRAGEKISDEEQKQIDAKWWSEFVVAASWYPMALHYSIEGGVGLTLGMIGLCGIGANMANFRKMWESTKDKK